MGSLTLVEGDSHAGKSVLSQQMVWGSLQDGLRVSVFTTENTVSSLIRQMDSLSLDVLDWLLLRRLRVFPMEVSRLEETALQTVLQAVKDQRERDMVFIDSLTPCIVHSSPAGALSFFEECKRLGASGLTIVIVIHSHAVSPDLLVRLQSLCDAHLQLRTKDVGDRLLKSMQVSKVRGATKKTGNIVSFDIEPGWGMRIVPISKAQG